MNTLDSLVAGCVKDEHWSFGFFLQQLECPGFAERGCTPKYFKRESRKERKEYLSKNPSIWELGQVYFLIYNLLDCISSLPLMHKIIYLIYGFISPFPLHPDCWFYVNKNLVAKLMLSQGALAAEFVPSFLT